jgi:hypothetical protein
VYWVYIGGSTRRNSAVSLNGLPSLEQHPDDGILPTWPTVPGPPDSIDQNKVFLNGMRPGKTPLERLIWTLDRAAGVLPAIARRFGDQRHEGGIASLHWPALRPQPAPGGEEERSDESLCWLAVADVARSWRRLRY